MASRDCKNVLYAALLNAKEVNTSSDCKKDLLVIMDRAYYENF